MHKINNYDVSVLIKLKIFNLLSEDRGLWVMGIILNEKPPKNVVFLNEKDLPKRDLKHSGVFLKIHLKTMKKT